MSGRPMVWARLPATMGPKTNSPIDDAVTPGPDEVGGSPDHDLDVAACVRVEQLLRHRGAGRALLVLGTRRCGLGHRCAAGGAVRVEVLERDEPGAGCRGGADDRVLQRRELLRPPVVVRMRSGRSRRCSRRG